MSEAANSNGTVLTPASKSNLWFYPGEVLAPGEMRITLMGTGWGNVVSPAQKGPSIFVELGNETEDSFVFDVGPGCILNYNAMGIPMSRMSRIFISHLHMDHCSDLPFIYAFGPNLGDRFKPLKIYGPSGPDLLDEKGDPTGTKLGIRNMVRGMEQFTQWHTTSFKTMSDGAEKSYDLSGNVTEFDFRVCGGVALEKGTKGKNHDHFIITHFPAVHIIDGAVSYRLEWSPKGREDYIVFVYSGDTLPSDFMLEYGQNADILIHETAPSIDSVVNGAGTDTQEALAIVCNSHTPANSLGSILAKTKPKLGVTTHSPMDPRSIEDLILGVREGILAGKAKEIKDDENASGTALVGSDAAEKQGYQVGADLMVFNLNKENEETVITTRMSALIDRPWPVREETSIGQTPPLGYQVNDYRTATPIDYSGSNPDKAIFDHVNYSHQCQVYLDDKDTNTEEE